MGQEVIGGMGRRPRCASVSRNDLRHLPADIRRESFHEDAWYVLRHLATWFLREWDAAWKHPMSSYLPHHVGIVSIRTPLGGAYCLIRFVGVGYPVATQALS